MTDLGCPDCGGLSFSLKITGHQEKASFVLNDQDEPYCYEAGAVTVEEHDPDNLICQSCGNSLSEDDLVLVEV